LLTSDIAAVRQSASDAGTAVFTIQIFTDAIETVAEKLIKMFEMAKKALFPDDSEEQIEDWKSFLRKLAEEINQIADGTKYNFIKPFAESGKTFSIPIGNGSMIDVFA
jgi:flagellin-like hook-associated protein FlgL